MFSKSGIIIIFPRISFSFDLSNFQNSLWFVCSRSRGGVPVSGFKTGAAKTFLSQAVAVLVAQKVRKTLKCYICHRPQCVYSNTELTRCISMDEYACGGSLVPDDNPRRRLFIVRRELTCQLSMEVPYHSAKRVKLPSVCFHCGGNSGAVLANDADIIGFCKDAGKKPATHGTKFVTKK